MKKKQEKREPIEIQRWRGRKKAMVLLGRAIEIAEKRADLTRRSVDRQQAQDIAMVRDLLERHGR